MGFSIQDLEERFNLDSEDILGNYTLFRPQYRPTNEIPTISKNSPNKLVLRYWSILPPWIEDPKDLKFPTFNARSDGLREKKTFKPSWENKRRCIIPVSYFIEWKKIYEGEKIIRREPFAIRLKNEAVFSLAGLYSPWKEFETATIITVDPNHDMLTVHNRMPAILAKEDEETWLDKSTDLDEAYSLLQPYPEGELIIEPIDLKKPTQNST